MTPTMKNIAALMMPCDTIMKIAPFIPAVVSIAAPSTTYPMWLTELYATSFLKSRCPIATSAP